MEELRNKSENRLEALDLFLLLDHENDHFLKFEEISTIYPFIEKMSKKEDKGKIHSLEDLRENFEFFEHLQIDKSTFNKFVDRCGFNVGIIRDNFYDKSYEGCCSKIFCRCCKCCNRMLRKKMVKKMMEKEDEQLRLFVYDEREKRSKLQDIIAVVLAIVQAKSEVMHHVADFILCYTVYWTGMEA